jgi:predicted Zn-dependent protease
MMLYSFALAASLVRPVVCMDVEPELVTRAWQEAAAQKIDARHQADIDSDIKVGKKYSEEAEKEFKLSKNEDYQKRVERIGGELAAIARARQVEVTWGDKRLNPFPYQFKVVEDKDINAFSLPGGYIYVYEGLMKFAESDDELAGVLAHEISHAAFRHVATLQREANKLQIVTIPLILVAILGGNPEAGNLAGLFTQAKTSGWSVQAEEAADFGGFQYMRESKYNPVGMLTFMEHLAKEQKAFDRIDLGILRTHPPSRERAETLAKRLEDADIPIRRSLVSPAYRTILKDGDKGTVEAWFDSRKLVTFAGPDAKGRALEAAERMDAFFDSVPELFDLQAQGEDTILGKRVPLLRITRDDAGAAGTTISALRKQTENAMKASLYRLAYRVWDGW